jgi:hypothetical protein
MGLRAAYEQVRRDSRRKTGRSYVEEGIGCTMMLIDAFVRQDIDRVTTLQAVVVVEVRCSESPTMSPPQGGFQLAADDEWDMLRSEEGERESEAETAMRQMVLGGGAARMDNVGDGCDDTVDYRVDGVSGTGLSLGVVDPFRTVLDPSLINDSDAWTPNTTNSLAVLAYPRVTGDLCLRWYRKDVECW